MCVEQHDSEVNYWQLWNMGLMGSTCSESVTVKDSQGKLG
jgi:hypothetical protein